MIYYIKNNIIFCSSLELQKEIKCDKTIDSIIEKWVYENWKIIDYKDSIKWKKETLQKEAIIKKKNDLENSIPYKTNKIKQEYNEIILAKYPYFAQINMSADIQEIHLTARDQDRSFTEDEMLKVWEAKEMKDWIQLQRDECKTKIAIL